MPASIRYLVFVTLFVALSPSYAKEVGLGSNLDQLLFALVKEHPALKAAKHAEDAASQEAIAAGSLEDPKFAVRFEDIDERDIVPNRLGTVYYDFSQSIPLGGKREARRALAEVDVERAKRAGALSLADLKYQMRTAYVKRYLALERLHLVQDRQKILHDLARLASSQLEQGLGSQQDAIRAEIETQRIHEDVINAEGEVKKEEAKINLMLGREVSARLAAPESLPHLPKEADLDLSLLLDRLGRDAPDLALPQADIIAAERGRTLARSNWWPDLDLRGSIVDRNGKDGGYEAQIGFNVPLQWGLREAQEQAAVAKLAAANDRQEELKRAMAAQLQDAYWGFITANRHETLIREEVLPRWRIAIENARNAYSAGQASINDALNALRSLKEAEEDYLGIRLQQQEMLARLERAIGGEL